MEREEEGDEPQSLFPLFPASNPRPPPSLPPSTSSQWLSNASFTADLSSIPFPPAAAGAADFGTGSDDEGDAEAASGKAPSYDLVGSSGSSVDEEGRSKRGREEERSKRRRRKKRRKERSGSGEAEGRKSGVRAWVGSGPKAEKDYYIDGRGDPDNLAFGSLYRMDVAHYRNYGPVGFSGPELQIFYRWRYLDSASHVECDIDVMDNHLKSGGRYYSKKISTLERNKGFKHMKVVGIKSSSFMGEFIPFVELNTSFEDDAEESWDDEMLRRTREFNKTCREHPHDEKAWIAFADFQDKIASFQSQKGARLQILEKKISILEKAVELNPECEELILNLLKSYARKDSGEALIRRWEKVLMQHSDSVRLWKEFLLFVQGDFSRFKVSDVRKRYAHAIQALSSACNRLHRQACQHIRSQQNDPDLVRLELGLVDIFLNLCRFEWQTGFQELTTGLFQAEIEYSLFCPSLDLSSQSKQRLFEHFWNNNVTRIGEDDAIGWSVWIEKEEEQRQNIARENSMQESEGGGWTGWFNPLSADKGNDEPENKDEDVGDGDAEEGPDTEDTQQEEDVEILLKRLGISADTDPHSEVKDAITWNKWSQEETIRDSEQWMPVRDNSGMDNNDQLSREILFEDVIDYLFSLHSSEARFYMIQRFIDFYGGKISQWACTNSLSWTENSLSFDVIPGYILDHLRDAVKFAKGSQCCSDSLSLDAFCFFSSNMERKSDVIRFLRNSLLLCLTIFPRNYLLEEALLVTEEMVVCPDNSSTMSVTPSQALAKRLLKNDRQDLLLSGLYAQREATYGNIDRARKVFDMTLSLIDNLPADLKETAPLLYLWYAEIEIENISIDHRPFRAIHILSCLGGDLGYTSFNGQGLSLRQLKAHGGFKEKINHVHSAWSRGVITDQSVALVCAASLFEFLTTGWEAGVTVIEEALSATLPERRSQSLQLESLCVYYVKLLRMYLKEIKLPTAWTKILQGLQTYPYNPKVLSSIIELGCRYTVPQKIRHLFDELFQRKPSVALFLFVLSYELGRTSSQHRMRRLFERAVRNDKLQKSVILWRCYLAFEVHFANNYTAAKHIYFRAIHACPWSKKLWLDGFQKLSAVLTVTELSDLQEVMRDKELNLRTDIYEILLQDEFNS